MTALKVIGVILLLILILLLLRVGVIVDFGDTLRVRLRIGPFRRKLLPNEKEKKVDGQVGTEKTVDEKTLKQKKTRGHPELPPFTFDEWKELAGVVFGTLGRTLRRTCRRTRIDPLEVGVTLAGDDPAVTAQTYGRANAALWMVMPKLEELFCIPRPSIYLGLDFEKKETSAEGTVGVSLRVWDLLAILFTLAFPLAGWFLRYRKKHKNDAAGALADQPAPDAEPITEKQTA